MRIGLVARCDRSGLGYQTKALYDLLKPSKVLLIDSTPFNRREQNIGWYKDPIISVGFPNDIHIDKFLTDLDVIITCEIPYNYNIFKVARQRGIKTVLQPNPEFNQHFKERRLPLPDAFFLPSTWYESETQRLGKTYLCPPPIDLQPTPLTNRKESGQLNVLHIAGRKAASDRNGTELVRQIGELRGVNITIKDQNTEDVLDQKSMYEGDYHVMLLPRRYGGLCLPMLESLGYGLPVLMPNVSPNNDILPSEWLMLTEHSGKLHAKITVDLYTTLRGDMKIKLMHFRNMGDEVYQQHRQKALDAFATYQAGLGKWMEYLREVVDA